MNSSLNHSFAESPQLALDFLTPARDSLGERFMNAGAVAVADFEMLAMILARALPHQQANRIAEVLMAEFGNFAQVITATSSRLLQVAGMNGAAVQQLKLIEAAAHRLGKTSIQGRDVISSWSALMEYCKISMAHSNTEQFRVFFLDRKNILIADEAQANGTIDHVPVYPREVVKRALELNASAIILAHNHPSGDPSPSQEDIDMTKRIAAAADTLGITLHDHIVIGKGAEVSFRSQGLL